MTPRERASLRAGEVFGEMRGYSALWTALVDAYEALDVAKEKLEECEAGKQAES